MLVAYVYQCSSCQVTPVVSLRKCFSTIWSGVVDCSHRFMKSVAAFRMLLHPVEEWLCSVEGHGERCLDQPLLWNREFLHRVRELAGGRVNIVNHMAHNGVDAHGVLGHERRDTCVRYVTWSRLFEKSICDGELDDSSGTVFIHTTGLGNLREGCLSIDGNLCGHVESVYCVQTCAVMALYRS